MKNNIENEIWYEDVLIAKIINFNSLKKGLHFFTNNESFMQFGAWNYDKGKELEPHFHNTFERVSNITQEAVVVIKGKIKCELYEKNGNFISSHVLQKNQAIIQFGLVHKYIILKKSLILEFKNGPYFGPEKDRTRIKIN